MKKHLGVIIISIFVLLLFAGHMTPQAQEIEENEKISVEPAFLSANHAWTDSVLSTMSLEEKIGQFLMVAAYSNKGPGHREDIKRLISKYHIGGLIFMQGGPVRQAKLCNHFQAKAKVPLLVGMDAEWGLAMRLDSTIRYPEQMMLGAIQDNYQVYKMGRAIGAQLNRLGVHVNFAPVLDVNNNPMNPVISSRSFGEDKENVARKGLAYTMGLQDSRVLATGKHFPGHGDTETDSHHALPRINHSLERLEAIELYPFRELVQDGIGGIMTAHLDIPALEKTEGLPATLSQDIINGLLKEEMGFKGLVISDAFNMKGVEQFGPHGDIEARAFQAGNDIILFPLEVPKVIDRMQKLVRKGEISREEIDRRCRKILSLKAWAGLDQYQPIQTDSLYQDLNQVKYKAVNRELVSQAITLLSDPNGSVPMKDLHEKSIISIAIGEEKENTFQQSMKQYHPVKAIQVSKSFSPSTFARLEQEVQGHDLVVLSVHSTSRYAYKHFGITDQSIELVKSLTKKHDVVLSIFGNAYSLQYFDRIEKDAALMMCYEDTRNAQDIAAQVIFGGTQAKGKLPVTAGSFLVGQGLHPMDIKRFSYGLPEERGMDSEHLARIDSIVQEGIDLKAMPGCQVLVAKDRKIVYHKNFGHHTYMKEIPVKSSDIYDIASITKIAATLPVLIKMHGEGGFSLDARLGDYLPHLDTTNKGGLIIRDVLAHQARLQPWIPFYIRLFRPLEKNGKLYSRSLSTTFPYELTVDFFMNKNFIYRDSVMSYCPHPDFPVKVAENLFLPTGIRDSIYAAIDASPLRERNGYKYSDLGYYYFYRMIEQATGTRFEAYTDSFLYNRLGAKRTVFHPRDYFSMKDIVPTENDYIFRKQLIHGHVHDPGAAMLGGACGHAGLFSTAGDLAKIMQMYLDHGEYGGVQFLDSASIQAFVQSPFMEDGNRRGVGFDKPETDPDKIGPTCDIVSKNSFGHTGFTGTMAWADPDYNLVYIFLSNRVHPDQTNHKLISGNIRTRIQKVIYQSLAEKTTPLCQQ